MKYYGIYDTNPKSKTYKTILNVARIQAPPEAFISQRWDLKAKIWIRDDDMYFKVSGLLDGLDFHEITEAQANKFTE